MMLRQFGRRPGALRARAGNSAPVDPPPTGDGVSYTFGVHNYGTSTVPAGSVMQLGLPVDQALGIDFSTASVSLTRSGGTSVPAQVDMVSTTREGGDGCFAVLTLKTVADIAADAIHDHTVVVTPGGGYSPGSDVVTQSQFNAFDFKIAFKGDDIGNQTTDIGYAYINSTDCVRIKKVVTGSLVTGWEGASRVKFAGSPVGYYLVEWRAIADANVLNRWRIEAVIHLTGVNSAPFAGSNARGRTVSLSLMSGSTVLNNSAAFQNVWISGCTSIYMYQGTDTLSYSYGGTTLREVHDRDYLVQAKACLPYRWSAAEGLEQAGWYNAYYPGSVEGFKSGWGDSGSSDGIGWTSSVSYQMMQNPSDFAYYKRGFDAGLKQLSVHQQIRDLTTGWCRPKFGSYTGMSAANEEQIWASGHPNDTVLTTFDSSGNVIMSAEFGHWNDTAYVPAMLTGRLPFICAMQCWALLLGYKGNQYNCHKCVGRPRRFYHFFNPGYSGSDLYRYDTWPWRDLLNYIYVAGYRDDAAYARAVQAETAAYGKDRFEDFCAWEDTSATSACDAFQLKSFNGVKDGTDTGNSWKCAIFQWSFQNGMSTPGWSADNPWCTAYMVGIMYLADLRNGETGIKPMVNNFFGRNILGPVVGPGACPAYGGDLFAPPGLKPSGGPVPDVIQDWGEYTLTYMTGVAPPPVHDTCPTSRAPQGGVVAPTYVNALALGHYAGWGSQYGKTYKEAYDLVRGIYDAAAPGWETVGGYGRFLAAIPA